MEKGLSQRDWHSLRGSRRDVSKDRGYGDKVCDRFGGGPEHAATREQGAQHHCNPLECGEFRCVATA